MRRLAGVLAAVSLAACSHSEPYAIEEPPPNSPVMIGAAQQLTFGPEGDWAPVWLPDGSALGFSMQRLDKGDRDRCLAWLPAAGGRAGRMTCRVGPLDADTTNVIWTHAVSAAGRIAYVYQSGSPNFIAPAWRGLYLGDAARPESARVALGLPYLSETGVAHHLATQMVWRDEGTLVYLAKHVQTQPGAIGIPPDTNVYGLEVVTLWLNPVPSRRTVPGTSGATGLALDRGTGKFFATFAFDSVVYELDLQTGDRLPAVSFGSLGTVRDIQVSGGRVYGIVGGFLLPAPAVFFGVDTQHDEGGAIAVADIGGGPPQYIENNPDRVYLNLALSPAGDRLAAEGFSVSAGIVARPSNLWMFRLP